MSLSNLALDGAEAATSVKLKLDQSSGGALDVLNTSGNFTIMCWAWHAFNSGVEYRDVFGIRDSSSAGSPGTDQILGVAARESPPGSGIRCLNVGSAGPDAIGAVQIPDSEWSHYTMVGEIVATTQDYRLTGYLNGIEQCRSDDTSMIGPVFPFPLCWIQFFNTRSSDSDSTGVWKGYLSAGKVWSNAALTPEEIRREMWSYWPVRVKDCFAALPMADLGSAGYNLMRPDKPWTAQGPDLATGAFDPPGVSWIDPTVARAPANFFAPTTAALSGTALAGISETDIVAGGKTIIITLNGDTWIPN